MTNIFQNTPIYISATDVKQSTTNSSLAALTDPEVDVLINKAQTEIDCYIGKSFWPPFDDTQPLLFPALKDDAYYLPDELVQATFYVVEKLFAIGSTIGDGLPYQDIKSESIGPRSYKYGDKNQDRFGFMIPDIAIKLIEKLKNRFCKQFLGPNSNQ